MPMFGWHFSGAGTSIRSREEWSERPSEEKFFFYRITQATVLRLLTTETVMSDVKPMAEAWWSALGDDCRTFLQPKLFAKN